MSGAPLTGTPASRTIRFPDGSTVELRFLGSADGRLIAGFAAQMSTASEYRRFFSVGSRTLRTAWVERMIGADRVNHMVAGAVATNEFGVTLVAIAESVRLEVEGDTAEVAVIAADDWQHLGIGTLLTRYLAERVVDAGVRFWEAHILAENPSMSQVLDNVATPMGRHREDGLLVTRHMLEGSTASI